MKKQMEREETRAVAKALPGIISYINLLSIVFCVIERRGGAALSFTRQACPECLTCQIKHDISKVGFCRVRTNHTRVLFTPGITLQRTSVGSVGH